MSARTFSEYREIWAVDFEFTAPPGERPIPICLVAWEINSGRKIKIWKDQLLGMQDPPYSIADDSLFVAYYASAEMGCHLALDWPLPENLLDLYAEFRNLSNGLSLPCGKGLVGALVYFGLNGVEAVEKVTMRQLVMSGGPWTPEEQEEIISYCSSDVEAVIKLLLKMKSAIDLPRALVRGRYMKAAANIENIGTPIDTIALQKLRERWQEIQDSLIAEIDVSYGIYDGRTFKRDLFAAWLSRNTIPWPRLKSGNLDLSDDAFRQMARIHPSVAPLRELRVALSQMRLADLAVGSDGRNRCLLSAFQARTGRNQPSNNKFIFGPSVWLRGLIRPASGHALAYLDWSQQEHGIAASLSGDSLMIEAYQSGDPYLTFAKQAGAVPSDATKKSHPVERAQFKECVLAVQYGMKEDSLATRIGQSVIHARELLRQHRETYRVFWNWSDSLLDYALQYGHLYTTFGWTIHIGLNFNPRSLRNFPMQGNGSEMLRLACCFAIERGVRVCAPVHDAILIEAPLEKIDTEVAMAQKAMSDASAVVLDSFRLRSEAKIIRYPERYMDERGEKMWKTIWDIVKRIDKKISCAPMHTHPVY